MTPPLQKLRGYLAGGNREGLEEMFRLSTVRRAMFDKKQEAPADPQPDAGSGTGNALN